MILPRKHKNQFMPFLSLSTQTQKNPTFDGGFAEIVRQFWEDHPLA
jgi:hypothetical protein